MQPAAAHAGSYLILTQGVMISGIYHQLTFVAFQHES
jgi:hypothetical protein